MRRKSLNQWLPLPNRLSRGFILKPSDSLQKNFFTSHPACFTSLNDIFNPYNISFFYKQLAHLVIMSGRECQAVTSDCPRCDGSGRRGRGFCHRCGGHGTVLTKTCNCGCGSEWYGLQLWRPFCLWSECKLHGLRKLWMWPRWWTRLSSGSDIVIKITLIERVRKAES